MNNLVEIKNLYFSFGQRQIFSGIDIHIPQGKIVAIMGPSGTGKTTLLRLIGRELMPSQGEIVVGEQNLATLSRKKLYNLRQAMGLLFQNGALFTNLSVFENVAFPLREHTKLPEAIIHNIVLMKLELVGLRGAKNLMPAQLSGGMARRVALARAIALDPKLIMYDEPFTGLDPISMGVIVKLIKEINQALGMTTILVSHDVNEVRQIADYVYMLSEGKIIGEGSPKDLDKEETPAIKQFIHGLADGVVPFHYPARDFKEELLTE